MSTEASPADRAARNAPRTPLPAAEGERVAGRGPRTPLPAAEVQRVVNEATRANLDLVRFLYVDHSGVVRGKATSIGRLGDRMQTGIGLTVAMQAMNMLDQLQPVQGMGPVGEIRLVPDPSSFVVLPYAPGAGAMMSDMLTVDGEPWAACPRSFLKGAIDRAAALGYALLAAIEPEFLLGVRETGPDAEDRIVPVDESLCFSTTGFAASHEFAIDFVRALQLQDLQVEQFYPELGHGQQELSISPAPVLAAADRQVWYRETARGVAWRKGLWASLAPKPIPDQAGNGAHIHFSLWGLGDDGAPGDSNAFYAAHDRYGLSDQAYHFIGGILAHLPGLLAITCPSVNSYRRLQPGHWSSAYVCWGPDNREAAVRIPSRMWGHDEASTNLELKSADATGNPYLSLGALLLAGLDGIERKLDPGDGIDVDPATLGEDELRRRGIARFPTSLGEALDALERDEFLMEALGPLRRSAYLAVKRSEVEAFAAEDEAFECLQHALRF